LADIGQLERVVTNLAVNARDAMTTGGRLDIGLTGHGKEVVLSVSDTGPGIEPHLLPHVFEPFFTTKSQGKGTGLGLATCYGIVRQAGGRIEVDSVVGVGTTFRVVLPAAPPGERPPEPATLVRDAEPPGEAEILVVEDEPQVRQFLVRSLTALGYDVTAVEHGKEAVALATQRAAPFDLVVTDVVMPVMGGVEMVERLRERWPTLEAVYLSGYTDDRVLRAEIATDPLHFLAKPFSRDALAERVRALLSRRA
jgi:CheY-like chemotaxis protein